MARLGRLLRQINGVTRMRWMNGLQMSGASGPGSAGSNGHRPKVFLTPGRPSPSSGARYPIELYVACGPYEGLPAGLFHYDPAHHGLDRLRTGDGRALLSSWLSLPPAGTPELVLVFTTVFWRNSAKYGRFGYRLQCLDAGVLIAQALAVGATAGLSGAVHLSFADEEIDRLLGLDPYVEGVLAVVTLTPSGRGARSRITPPKQPDWSGPAPAEVTPLPAITTIPGLTDLAALHTAARRSSRPKPSSLPSATDASSPVHGGSILALPGEHLDLAAGLCRRRTVYGYRGAPLPRADLARLLRAVTQPLRTDAVVDPADRLGTLLWCVPARTEGVAPGSYRYERTPPVLVRTRPEQAVADLARSAKTPIFREELRTASLTVVLVGDFARGLPVYEDRWYRMQNIGAGILAQRTCLAAAALGADSHVHCDFDIAVVNEALGLGGSYGNSYQALLLVTVGLCRPEMTDPQCPL